MGKEVWIHNFEGVDEKYVNISIDVLREYLGLKSKRGFSIPHKFLQTIPKRKTQYNALFVLKEVEFPAGLNIILVHFDLYVPGTNFVFGVARPKDGCATVSIWRLKSVDKCLELERVIKEVLHEVGHLLGLPHCPDPHCVMHFSNTLWDTDIKGPEFCKRCSKILVDSGVGLNVAYDFAGLIAKYVGEKGCLEDSSP